MLCSIQTILIYYWLNEASYASQDATLALVWARVKSRATLYSSGGWQIGIAAKVPGHVKCIRARKRHKSSNIWAANIRARAEPSNLYLDFGERIRDWFAIISQLAEVDRLRYTRANLKPQIVSIFCFVDFYFIMSVSLTQYFFWHYITYKPIQ